MKTRRPSARPWPILIMVCALLACGSPAVADPATEGDTGAAEVPVRDEAAAVDEVANTTEPGDASDTPTAEELLKAFDEMYESTGTTARVEVVIVTPKKTRTMRMRFWSKGDDKALIVIDAPSRDAGTATLKVDKNLWNYLPKISRTIRVPPSMMMGAWMGSDLTNDDLVRDSSYEEDYDSELVGTSEDPPGWRVELTAKPDAVGLWSRVETVFSFDDRVPVEARYYDRKDRLSRTVRFDDVREMGGRRVPMLTTVVPEREEGRRTEFRYLSVEFDADLDDDMFSLSRLERTH